MGLNYEQALEIKLRRIFKEFENEIMQALMHEMMYGDSLKPTICGICKGGTRKFMSKIYAGFGRCINCDGKGIVWE